MIKTFLYSVVLTLGISAQAQIGCRVASQTAQTPKENYTAAEVEAFVYKNNVLPGQIVQKIKARLDLFRLTDEDLGNAFLMNVFAELGPYPSRRRDQMVSEFLSPVFWHSYKQFETFAAKLPKGWPIRVPNLFGLSSLGFKADAYGYIHWDQAASKKFLELMRTDFSKTMGFDLLAANRKLALVDFLQSQLRGDKTRTLQDLKFESDNYMAAENRGHVFFPKVRASNISDHLALWHLTAPNKRLTIPSIGAENNVKVRAAITRALETHAALNPYELDSSMLAKVVYVFMTQPRALIRLASNGARNPDSFSNLLVTLAKENADLYPMIQKNEFAEFKVVADYWIRLLKDEN